MSTQDFSTRDDPFAQRQAQSSQAAAAGPFACPLLTSVDPAAWHDLAVRCVEPNGYFLPAWELGVDARPGERHARVLLAINRRSLTALLPVVSCRDAYALPLPALVSAHPYGDLGTPLIDRSEPHSAAGALLARARQAGARALVLRDVPLNGAALHAFERALAPDGLQPVVIRRYLRAALDATQDPQSVLTTALGSRRMKELRRLSRRLEDHGVVRFAVAQAPAEVERAVRIFLTLEASGWKGQRGTAMAMRPGEPQFLVNAATELAATRSCEVVTLHAGEIPVAAGMVLRHLDRAFWFKLGIDERFARYSPGVQLALGLTTHLCADPDIRFADSTAAPDHPMIDPIWRGRLAIGDVLLPLRSRDPVVTLTVTALKARHALREQARHWLRRRKSR